MPTGQEEQAPLQAVPVYRLPCTPFHGPALPPSNSPLRVFCSRHAVKPTIFTARSQLKTNQAEPYLPLTQEKQAERAKSSKAGTQHQTTTTPCHGMERHGTERRLTKRMYVHTCGPPWLATTLGKESAGVRLSAYSFRALFPDSPLSASRICQSGDKRRKKRS